VRCKRCNGLLVAERFFGETSPLGGWTYEGVRCLNCGAVFALKKDDRRRPGVPAERNR
jgi:hypothetical protein